MGPGFWPVTWLLTVLNAILVWWLWQQPFSDFLPEAARPADQIDALFKALALIGTVIFVYVTGYLLFFSIAYRHRATDPPDAIGVQVSDVPALEVAYWIVPTILVLFIAAFSVVIWRGLQQSLGDVLTMEAVGHQFYFEGRYPRLPKPVQRELHLPVGTPVTLHVSSADVIHSFWVPEIRLKADMVPGLVSTLRFTPDRIGRYHLICTEFCGIAHGQMTGTVVIESQQDFGRWLAAQLKQQQASAAPGGGGAAAGVSQGVASAGQALFNQKCAVCHSTGKFDEKKVGPGLGNLLHDPAHPKLVNGQDPSPENIAGILRNGYQGPLGVMPNQQANGISDQDISNLAAYLVSLSK
jgi:cytochrome c oxidase subunit II